ncbi:hypothetical protein cypCar_00007567 [Cyprinus carpio]|nr:hypothetical protein cypCar_00007567 [Cyprinus carpio]
MQKLIQNTLVTLDPNTANTHLILSDDLTILRHNNQFLIIQRGFTHMPVFWVHRALTQDQLSRALKSSQEKTENEECDEVLHIKDTYSNIEKLKLFCLDEEQPVCVVCRDSEKHLSHRFRPINEVVSSYKEQLKTALKSLEEKLKHIENNKRDCDKTIQLIKTQAEGTEWQINKEFKKLHQFLRDEEEASITALRKDEEQKSQKMKEKLEEMNRQISALSDTIKDIKEKMMPHTSDASFLHVRTEYLFLCTKQLAYCPAWSNSHFVLIRCCVTCVFDCYLKLIAVLTGGCYFRAQSSQQDPQMLSGALIDVAGHLRNLTFRVWKKMQELVRCSE